MAGYKNLEQPIVLDGLGSINVIHGANNVGKSNLLQAIDLFFRCLTWPSGGMPFGENQISVEHLLVPDIRSLFHLERPLPIVLAAVLDIRPEELLSAGVQTDLAATEVDLEITLEWRPPQRGAMHVHAAPLRGWPLPMAIVVPALAHMEVLHDLRTTVGARPFDRARERGLSAAAPAP